jgi:hypothetical protein
VEAKVGADLSMLRQVSGHTTTQPSSIEEEGERKTTRALNLDSP